MGKDVSFLQPTSPYLPSPTLARLRETLEFVKTRVMDLTNIRPEFKLLATS